MGKKQQDKKVKEWNAKYPIGTPVRYEKIKGGRKYQSKTKSLAFISNSGTPVIFLEDVSGYYDLSHIEPDKERRTAKVQRRQEE